MENLECALEGMKEALLNACPSYTIRELKSPKLDKKSIYGALFADAILLSIYVPVAYNLIQNLLEK